ncbi:MAG: hypothetical protein HYX48_07625 [Chlamydiales bacterium]|nr:hypothetical protein [Chlamydiales bacterium]
MKDLLTNEKLKGLFKSNFELARHAIQIARYYVKSGRELYIDDLLEEIRFNPKENFLEEMKEQDAKERAASHDSDEG